MTSTPPPQILARLGAVLALAITVSGTAATVADAQSATLPSTRGYTGAWPTSDNPASLLSMCGNNLLNLGVEGAQSQQARTYYKVPATYQDLSGTTHHVTTPHDVVEWALTISHKGYQVGSYVCTTAARKAPFYYSDNNIPGDATAQLKAATNATVALAAPSALPTQDTTVSWNSAALASAHCGSDGAVRVDSTWSQNAGNQIAKYFHGASTDVLSKANALKNTTAYVDSGNGLYTSPVNSGSYYCASYAKKQGYLSEAALQDQMTTLAATRPNAVVVTPSPKPIAIAPPNGFSGAPVSPRVSPRRGFTGCNPNSNMWPTRMIDTSGLKIADDLTCTYYVVAHSHISRSGGSLSFFGHTVTKGTLVFPNGYYFAIPLNGVSDAAIAAEKITAVELDFAWPSRRKEFVDASLVHPTDNAQIFALLPATGGAPILFPASVIAAGGANVIAAGGANVIAAGGANVVAVGGANVIAAGGANIDSAGLMARANVVAVGGANVIAAGGAN